MNNAQLRKSLLGYSKWLRERAEAIARLPSASKDDRNILAEDREVLAVSVESLVEIIAKHDALAMWVHAVFDHLGPEDRAALAAIFKKPLDLDGLTHLSGVLAGAFQIGVLGFESPIMKQLEREARALRWRGGIRPKAQLRAEIWKRAEPLWRADRGLKAPQLARKILDQLNEDQKRRGYESVEHGTVVRRLNEEMAERGLRARRRASKICTTS